MNDFLIDNLNVAANLDISPVHLINTRGAVVVGMVYNFLNSVLKNQSLAEDYTQWCFMQLWEHRVSISSTRNLPAWLYVTARNAALKEARRQLTIARYVEYSVNFKDRVDSQRNPDSDLAVIQSEMSKVIEKLPESRRQIFLMRTVQGKSVSAIAEELGISPKTVETQIASEYKEHVAAYV